MTALTLLVGLDGTPIYVNPAHVVSVMPSQQRPWGDNGYDGPVTTVHMVQPDNGWIVRGTVEDITTALNVGAAA